MTPRTRLALQKLLPHSPQTCEEIERIVRREVNAALERVRQRTEDLEAVRDAALNLLNVHDDNDDDSPFPSILVDERSAVRAALQRLNANDAVRARAR